MSPATTVETTTTTAVKERRFNDDQVTMIRAKGQVYVNPSLEEFDMDEDRPPVWRLFRRFGKARVMRYIAAAIGLLVLIAMAITIGLVESARHGETASTTAAATPTDANLPKNVGNAINDPVLYTGFSTASPEATTAAPSAKPTAPTDKT